MKFSNNQGTYIMFCDDTKNSDKIAINLIDDNGKRKEMKVPAKGIYIGRTKNMSLRAGLMIGNENRFSRKEIKNLNMFRIHDSISYERIAIILFTILGFECKNVVNGAGCYYSPKQVRALIKEVLPASYTPELPSYISSLTTIPLYIARGKIEADRNSGFIASMFIQQDITNPANNTSITEKRFNVGDTVFVKKGGKYKEGKVHSNSNKNSNVIHVEFGNSRIFSEDVSKVLSFQEYQQMAGIAS